MASAEAPLLQAIAQCDAPLVEALCLQLRAPPSPAALGAALALPGDRESDVLRILRTLLAHGAPVNRLCNGSTYPLQLAAQRTCLALEMLALLAEHGAPLELCDVHGHTALHAAAARSEPAVVRWLLDRGARPNPQDLRGRTPLCLALQRRHNAADVAALLVECGADVDRGNCLSSAINRCALLSDASGLRALAFLLSRGASPAAPNSHGLAAWHALSESNLAGPRLGAAYGALLRAGMSRHAPPEVLQFLDRRLHGEVHLVDASAATWLPHIEKIP